MGRPEMMAKSASRLNNSRFKILGFDGDPKVIERLRDLGFYTGDPIEIVGRNWLHDPIFVQVRRAVVALRREEFKCLKLESY